MSANLQTLFQSQKKNRWAVSQTSARERIAKLQKLKRAIQESEKELSEALHKDFRKPVAEVHLTEIFPALSEIDFMCANLHKWMKPEKVPTPLALWGSRTEIRSEARGLCLILSPWNYPFQLLINPLVAAVAAGNCVIAKPSEKTPATSAYLAKLISQVFPAQEVAVVEGEARLAEQLLELPFDHIFFTGSTATGRKVMAAASRHLASVTLELGGKSPVVIMEDADLSLAAQRIVWGKFINAGQTCVAPDYVFVPEKLAAALNEKIKDRIATVFGSSKEQQLQSSDLARIVDQRAFGRLRDLLQQSLNHGARLITGGTLDESQRFLAPTLLDAVPLDSPVMQEEIFGPILPVLHYQNLKEVETFLQDQEKPLALYVFGQTPSEIESFLSSTSAGGTVVNHLMVQFANPHAPFGGIGASGQGSYHGLHGFKTFSHQRTVVYQGRFGLSHWVFPPYEGTRFRSALKMLKLLSK